MKKYLELFFVVLPMMWVVAGFAQIFFGAGDGAVYIVGAILLIRIEYAIAMLKRAAARWEDTP